MCITAEEWAEEEEEEKICGQHFSGGQLQHTRSRDMGSCILAPALCYLPPCPGAALRPAAPSPDGKDHPNRSWVSSYLKRNEVERCSRMCCNVPGQQWKKNAEQWAWPWGCVCLPSTSHPWRADATQHRDHTHSLQAESRTMHMREQGVTKLSHTKGYESWRWAASPSSVPF